MIFTKQTSKIKRKKAKKEKNNGKLYVIDGTDGSGKQTQFKKLQERLTQDGIDYKVVSFPNYESDSSALVKMYLSGEFGTNAKEIKSIHSINILCSRQIRNIQNRIPRIL